MPCSVEELWAFHSSAEALLLLSPPGQRVEVEGETHVERGAIHRLKIVRWGVPLRWIAKIEIVEPPLNGGPGRFIDVAMKSPFASWRHEHRMEPTLTGSRLVDTVTYRPPFGILGSIADRLFLKRDIERLFAHRHAATRAEVS